MKPLIVAFITLAVGLGAVHLAGGEPVERQHGRDDSSLVSYHAFRLIRASNRRFKVSGEREVETKFSRDTERRLDGSWQSRDAGRRPRPGRWPHTSCSPASDASRSNDAVVREGASESR